MTTPLEEFLGVDNRGRPNAFWRHYSKQFERDEMSTEFECWGIVEIMGHQTYAGKITEQVVGGSSFVRVDIPDVEDQQGFSKLFGSGSIYAITPTTEEVARMTAGRVQQRPLSIYAITPTTKKVARMTAGRVQQRPLSIYDLPQEWRDKIRRPAITSGDSDDEGTELW